MRFGGILLAVMLVFLFAAPTSSRAASLSEVIAELRPGVVGVGTFQAIRQPQIKFVGTGFGVSDGQHIITNFHVVSGFSELAEKEYPVVLAGEGQSIEIFPAEIQASDEDHDLALLSISGGTVMPLKLAPSVRFSAAGTPVATTGFPLGSVLGLYPVSHTGIVSSVAPNLIPQRHAGDLSPRIVRSKRFMTYVLDLTAYPGNSGSPVYLAETGEVIAVVNRVFIQGTRENAVLTPSGISYAIPVKFVHRILEGVGLKP